MNIWLINHYAVPTKYYPLARPASFAKYLMRMGHTVTIFAASTVHNSDKNLITDGALFHEDYVDGIHYVYVRDCAYSGNGASRILNMLLFPIRLPRVCKYFEKPDAILSVSATPMACMQGLKLAKKYGCRGIAEVADLWPESFVAYGMIGKRNPLLRFMYAYEKRMYAKADAIIFTMEGGRDYIIEKGWDTAHGGPVDLNKVHHINNGVDLEAFDYNKEHHQIDDPDLEDPNVKRVIYTGSMREANRSITILPEVADELLRKGRTDIQILMYGRGDYAESFKKICEEREVHNLVYKGFVQKNEVPYLLSKAIVNILNCDKSEMSQYGSSQNKLFEYLASGHPILSGESDRYSIIINRNCGISKQFNSAEEIADAIIELVDHPEKYPDIHSVGEEYDFKRLTEELIRIIEA